MSTIRDKVSKNISKLSDEQILSYLDNLNSEIDDRNTVLDSLNDGYLFTDSSFRILYINQMAKKLLPVNASAPARKGITIDTFITDKQIFRFLRTCIKRRELKECYEYKDSNPFFGNRDIRIRALSFLKDGRGVFEIQDITFLKKLQREYSRNESLAAMTSMAAGVAHEIKNPLASMSIYVQLLSRKLDKNGSISKEEAQKTISVLNEEIEKLNKMAVDFLYAVKPVNAEFALDSVNKSIKAALEISAAEMEENKIQIMSDLAVSLPKVRIDVNLIEQCVLNLIRNAMQARKDGQTDLKILVRSYLDGNNVCISVEDNGCGISEEQMVRIFEPYYTTKSSGTGLGLTNIYKIVKEHRGDVTVNSKVNEGTVFTILLPVPSSERYRLE